MSKRSRGVATELFAGMQGMQGEKKKKQVSNDERR